MTKVTVYIGNGDGSCEMLAIGHATGSVEVCAGISAILYALAGTLENLKEMGKAEINEDNTMESGHVYLGAIGEEEVHSSYYMALIGLLQIEQANPEYISVTYDIS